MKKRNLVLRTAIASALVSMLGSAYAVNIAVTNRNFATEIFGPTLAVTAGIRPAAVTSTVATSNGIVINPGATVYFTIRLTNSTFRVAPLAGELTGTYANVGGNTNVAAGNAVLSTDRTTATFPLTFTATGTMGVGTSFIWTPIALAVDSVNLTMAIPTTTITATTALSVITPVVIAPSATTTPNTGTPIAGDLDGGASTAATIATSVPAVVFTVTPSSSFPLGYSLASGTGVNQAGILETAKLDLAAPSGPASRFSTPGALLSNANSATVLNLGAVIMGNTAGVQVKADGTTAYLISNAISFSNA